MTSWVIANTSKLPRSKQIHTLGDWAELLCLTSLSGALSVTDFDVFQMRRRDDPVESDGELEAIDKSFGDTEVEPPEQGDEAEYRDKLNARSVQVFEYLSARGSTFGEAYPFELDSRGDTLIVRDLSRHDRRVYLFLLLCSSLGYVDSKGISELTGDYEWLCLDATRKLFPAPIELHLFGKNPKLPERYTGKLSEKLRLLASDINETTKFDDDEFSRQDSGDKGLDIVGWAPLGDNQKSLATFFGQCACTPNWVLKKASSSYGFLKETINLTAPPVNMCFIPYDFRRPDGRWYKATPVSDIVLFDRRRLMFMLGALSGGQTWPAPKLIVPTLERAVQAISDAKDLI